MSKKLILITMLTLSLLLVGCGKQGESQAEDYVKEHLKVPNSYKKISYTLDEAKAVGILSYTAKNPMGVDIKNEAIFQLNGDKAEFVEIDSKISEETLKFFLSKDTKNFKSNIENYTKVMEFLDDMRFENKMMQDTWRDLNDASFFEWKMAKSYANKLNPRFKQYNDMYDTLSETVKEKIPKKLKYYKIDLSGDFMDFKANGERVDDYSLVDNQ